MKFVNYFLSLFVGLSILFYFFTLLSNLFFNKNISLEAHPIRFNSLVDLNLISTNSLKQVHFEICNQGKTDLIIQNISISCDCLSVIKPEKAIPYQHCIRLPVFIDLAGMRGEFARSLVLHTNSPKVPTLTLTIKGFATSHFDWPGKSIYFNKLNSQLDDSGASYREFTLQAKAGFKFGTVQCDNSVYVVSLQPQEHANDMDDNTTYLLRISVPPEYHTSDLPTATLIVETNDPQEPRLTSLLLGDLKS